MLAGVSDAYLRREWDRKKIMDEIKRRAEVGLEISPAKVQADDPGLWRAANKRFGRWHRALKAAGFDPHEEYERPERIAK